jgi:hypothetical protein
VEIDHDQAAIAHLDLLDIQLGELLAPKGAAN